MGKLILKDYIDSPKQAWLDLTQEDVLSLINPLTHRPEKYIERPDLHILSFMRDPRYVGFAAKHLLNIHLLPIQVAIIQEFWTRSFPMFVASRGASKTFLTAVFCLLKCALFPGTKIVVVGAAFRQSKLVVEYMETIWKNAPILRNLCSVEHGPQGLRKDIDRWTMHINNSWCIAIPIGNGDKIRGLRAHIICSDEFSSISPEIYETVIQGFVAVSADPVSNVKMFAERRALQKLGVWNQTKEQSFVENLKGNQSIITGTADYAFKHFAQYWKKYHAIVTSKGDPKKIAEIFGGEVPEHFNWKDYSIIRIPYERLPEGMMDAKQVTRAKGMVHMGIYQMEYGAVFTEDSDGFFKRTLVEACVASDVSPILMSNGDKIWFDASTRGNPKLKYVMGIDPASEVDNFTITILELHENHTRIVYCWSTNKKEFRKRVEAGLAHTIAQDYYGFCARKIRELMQVFNIIAIGIDTQGGGYSLLESLQDPAKMFPGEQAILPMIDPEKPADTDTKQGLHMIELIQFAKADWVMQANHGMKKDFTDKILLFPRFDTATIALAIEDDKRAVQNGDKSRLG